MEISVTHRTEDVHHGNSKLADAPAELESVRAALTTILPTVLDIIEQDVIISEDEWCWNFLKEMNNFSLVHRSWTAMSQARMVHFAYMDQRDPHRAQPLHVFGPSTRYFYFNSRYFSPADLKLSQAIGTCENLHFLRVHNYVRGLEGIISSLQNLQFFALDHLRTYEEWSVLFDAFNRLPRLEALSLVASFSDHNIVEECCDREMLREPQQRLFRLKFLRLQITSHNKFPYGLLHTLLSPSLQGGAGDRLSDLKLDLDILSSWPPPIIRPEDGLPSHLEASLNQLKGLRRLRMGGIMSQFSAMRQAIFHYCSDLELLHTAVEIRGTAMVRETYEMVLDECPESLRALFLEITFRYPTTGRRSATDQEVHWVIRKLDERIAQTIESRLVHLTHLDMRIHLRDKNLAECFPKMMAICAKRDLTLRLHGQQSLIATDPIWKW